MSMNRMIVSSRTPPRYPATSLSTSPITPLVSTMAASIPSDHVGPSINPAKTLCLMPDPALTASDPSGKRPNVK